MHRLCRFDYEIINMVRVKVNSSWHYAFSLIYSWASECSNVLLFHNVPYEK